MNVTVQSVSLAYDPLALLRHTTKYLLISYQIR